MSSCSLAASSTLVTLATLPTCTPRIFTLAYGSITSPDRSAVTVTGTTEDNVRLNAPILSTTAPATPRTNSRASQPEPIDLMRSRFGTPLSREIEVAGLTVECHGHEHDHERRSQQRSPGRSPHRRPHAGRPTACVEPVVGVDQHDRGDLGDGDHETAQCVGRVQERVEVVVVNPVRLAVKSCDHEVS